jgi:hypothetical protein
VIGGWAFHGHAIVSEDDRIAGPDGRTPGSLRNEADWRRFQAALDEAVITVLGRRGHEANPNRHGRNRLVLSSTARGLERRADAWWWNPQGLPLAAALAEAAPGGGVVAVPGGRPVFDLFLDIGFDEFHLARVYGVTVPDGVPVFTGVLDGLGADDILARCGLAADPPAVLDPAGPVELTRWHRP